MNIYLPQFHVKHHNCARCTSISRTTSSSMCAETHRCLQPVHAVRQAVNSRQSDLPTEKARRPSVLRRYCGTIKRCRLADRRCRLATSATEHCNYNICITHRFHDTTTHWPKISIFLYLSYIWRSCQGRPRPNFVIAISFEKTRMMGLCGGGTVSMMRLAVLSQCRIVTDWQTGGWNCSIIVKHPFMNVCGCVKGPSHVFA